jgi:hypothetical protein
MNTDKLERFLIGFKTEVLPLLREDNIGLVYEISQSLAEDPLIMKLAAIKKGSGSSSGEFMGVAVRTRRDFNVVDYRK